MKTHGHIYSMCIVDRSSHGVLKVVKTYGRGAFKFLGVQIMVTIPFDKKGFNTMDNFTENEKIIKLIQKITR